MIAVTVVSKQNRWCFAGLTAAWVLLACAGSVCAGEFLPREEVEARIETRVQTALKEQFDPKNVAEQLNLDWPVEPPEQPREEVLGRVNAAVEQAVEREYPAARLDEIEKEARKKYELYEPGDKVSFLIRGGLGPNAFVEGYLRKVNPTRVRIGNRWIVRSDIDDDILARLYPDEHKEAVEKYLRVHAGRFERRREDYEQQVRKKYAARFFREAGYVKAGERWVARDRFFKNRLAEEHKKFARDLRDRITRELYKEHGYRFDAEAGKWVPGSPVKRMASGFRGLFGGEESEPSSAKPKSGQEQQTGEGGGPVAVSGDEANTPPAATQIEKLQQSMDMDEARPTPEKRDTGGGAGAAFVGLGLLATMLLIPLAVHLFIAFCFKMMCEKAGTEPGVLVWLPILQLIPALRAGGLSGWLIILFFIPLVNLIMVPLMFCRISENRGKPPLLGLLSLVPGINILLVLYLAFSE